MIRSLAVGVAVGVVAALWGAPEWAVVGFALVAIVAGP